MSFLKDLFNNKTFQAIAPIAASFIPGVGPIAGAAIGAGIQGVSSAAGGGDIEDVVAAAAGGAASAEGEGGGFWDKLKGFAGSDAGKLLGIGAGTIAAGKLFGPDRPDIRDFTPEQRLTPMLSQVQDRQFERASAALAMGGDRAMRNLRAAGVTGSGLGASMSGVFAEQGNVLSGILANQGDAFRSALRNDINQETAIGLAEYQAAVGDRQATLEGIGQIGSTLSSYVTAQALGRSEVAKSDSTEVAAETINKTTQSSVQGSQFTPTQANPGMTYVPTPLGLPLMLPNFELEFGNGAPVRNGAR